MKKDKKFEHPAEQNRRSVFIAVLLKGLLSPVFPCSLSIGDILFM